MAGECRPSMITNVYRCSWIAGTSPAMTVQGTAFNFLAYGTIAPTVSTYTE